MYTNTQQRAFDPRSKENNYPPRSALYVTIAVFLGYALMTVNNVVEEVLGSRTGWVGWVGFGACLVVVLCAQVAHSTLNPRSWSLRARAVTLGVQTSATYLPFLWIGAPWGTMTGFLAGSFLLTLRTRLRWVLYIAVSASLPLVLLGQRMTTLLVIQLVVMALVTGLAVYGLGALSGLVSEVHARREELARIAVTQERLRVARDLHDLLGYNMSAMTLRSELAYRLLPDFPERASQEMENVLHTARRALAEVRVVASGFRDVSLVEEAETAIETLSAAGIEVRAEIGEGSLSAELDTVLATVLREAVTNVLRHSKAQACIIAMERDAETVLLRVSNDGVVTGSAVSPGGRGNGLDNLTERLAGVNGRLSTTITDHTWFHLTAEAPARTSPRADSARPD